MEGTVTLKVFLVRGGGRQPGRKGVKLSERERNRQTERKKEGER